MFQVRIKIPKRYRKRVVQRAGTPDYTIPSKKMETLVWLVDSFEKARGMRVALPAATIREHTTKLDSKQAE